MRLLIYIAVFFFNSFVFGQDLKKDLIQTNQYLNNLSNFSLEVNYAVNDSLNEQGSVSVYRSNEGFFYTMGSTNIVINQKNTLIIDNEQHTIIYSNNVNRKDNKKFDVQKSLLKGLDTLIAKVDSIYFTIQNDKKTYFLRSEKSYFNLIEIQFSKEMINQVVYYYNPDFVEGEIGLKAINNLKVEENPAFDQKLLTSNFYLQMVNGSYQPTEEFKKYILIYNESADEYFE